MESSVIILLLLLLCGVTVSPVRVYKFVSKAMDWYAAQKYCRQRNMDLATISNSKEQERLLWNGRLTYGWVGLKRTGPVLNTWQWSDGQIPTFFEWAFTEDPDYEQDETQYEYAFGTHEYVTGDEVASVNGSQENETHGNGSLKNETKQDCVIVTVVGWITAKCSSKWPFFCSKNMSLVKENKTWEEALEYCRTRKAALASPHWNAHLVDKEAAEAQSGTVWMGLRFINGKWLSLNGKEARDVFSRSECPAPPFRCGARNPNRGVWENRDCNEKLNFLCD